MRITLKKVIYDNNIRSGGSRHSIRLGLESWSSKFEKGGKRKEHGSYLYYSRHLFNTAVEGK